MLPISSEVAAILVTFEPEEVNLKAINRIAEIFSSVVAVSNCGSKRVKTLLESYGHTVLEPGKNIGLSAAYNRGIEFANKNGAKFFITFDQDTEITNSISSLISHVRRAEEHIYGANYGKAGDGERDLSTSPSELSECDWLISSSMCFSAQTFERVKGFDERYFIDYVDLEFCLKARALGIKTFIVNNVLIGHTIGSPQKSKLLMFKVRSSGHSPLRRYYMGRNLIYVTRSYAPKFPFLITKLFMSKLKMVFLILLAEKQKSRKLRMFARGLIDGWKGL